MLASLHQEERWPFAPTGAPDGLTFHGREYDRNAELVGRDEDYIEFGRTAEGGVIYGWPGDETGVASSLQVVSGDRVFDYGIVGSP